MSIDPEDVLVIVVWLVGACLIIIPKLKKKKNVSTNATNADIVSAIHSLKDSLKDTIYAVTIIQITIMVTLLK